MVKPIGIPNKFNTVADLEVQDAFIMKMMPVTYNFFCSELSSQLWTLGFVDYGLLT